MMARVVDDVRAKEQLHGALRHIRGVLLWKLDGLGEYDVRRPLTPTGTNILGLVKHLTVTEGRYLGEILGRPLPEPLHAWGDPGARLADLWATEHEAREEIVERYQRACAHADATIDELDLDAPGHVPWWPRPDVTLFAVLIHVLTETNRHVGHVDILREQLDGSAGADEVTALFDEKDRAFWADHVAMVERAARAASGSG